MTEQEQIEEMAKDLCRLSCTCEECQNVATKNKDKCKAKVYAERAYRAGYRKQSEGKWLDGICTNCGHEALDYLDETPCGCSMRTYITKYCPNCGARMTGVNKR